MLERLRNSKVRLLLQLAVLLPLWAGGLRTAHAHIGVEQGGTHKARFSDDSLKEGPCGAPGPRGTNIFTYKPGATINLSIVETIRHPGYFRIAFDVDGDDDFVPPARTTGEFGDCAGDPNCGPGKTDYCNNETVLLDYLNPHEGGFGSQPKYTWSIKLPDVECDNCTLQIIQVMDDLNIHPGAFPAGDIYYQCIDIVLANDAPDVTTTPVENDGIDCKNSSGPGGTPQAGSGATAGSAAPTAGSAAGAAGMMAMGEAGSTGAAGSSAGTAGQGGSGASNAGGGAAGMGGTPSTGAQAGASGPAMMPAAAGSNSMMSIAGSGQASSPVQGAAGGLAAMDPATEGEGGCRTAGGRTGTGTGIAMLFAMFVVASRRRGRGEGRRGRATR